MKREVFTALSVSIGSMGIGFNAAYTSTALASMSAENSTLSLTDDEKSWAGSLMPLSALTGSIIGGYLIDSIGRRMVIAMCGPPFIIAMLIIGSAINVWMVYVGRVIVGLCVGMLSLSLPIYLGETIKPEIRGTLGLLPTTIGNIGILVCFIIGTHVNWSYLAYIGAIIPFVFSCLMLNVPESPRWYISKGLYDKGRESLEWLRDCKGSAVNSELEQIKKNIEVPSEKAPAMNEILNRRYRKSMFLSIGLMLIQQLSGINAVIFYTVDIFHRSGSYIDGHLSTIIIGVVNLFATFVANIWIDKIGRRTFLHISSTGMVLSLFSLGSYFYILQLADEVDHENVWNEIVVSISWIPLVSLIVYIISFSLGWGPIPWLFMGETLPSKVRGTAASIVTAVNWSSTFLVTKSFPIMVNELGIFGVFFFFSGVMLLGLFYSINLIPETKGKTLEQIELELAGQPDSPKEKNETKSWSSCCCSC